MLVYTTRVRLRAPFLGMYPGLTLTPPPPPISRVCPLFVRSVQTKSSCVLTGPFATAADFTLAIQTTFVEVRATTK
jgi:hypothetical protein